jgi:hypothetical protein
MSSVFRFFFSPSTGPGGILLIRVAVGLIFLTQGFLKFSHPNMGAVRFTRISRPSFTVHFVGTFEIVCGVLVLVGLLDTSRLRASFTTGDCHDQNPGTFAAGTRLLVHGE